MGPGLVTGLRRLLNGLIWEVGSMSQMTGHYWGRLNGNCKSILLAHWSSEVEGWDRVVHSYSEC